MKSMMFLLILLVVFFSFTPKLYCGQIHGLLEEHLSNNNDDYQTVIISLSDRLDKQSLEKNIGLSAYTRQASHYLAIQALKDHAHQSQENIVSFLQAEKAKKNVRSFKAFWIDNLITAELKKELIFTIVEFPEVDIIYPDLEVSLVLPNEQHTPAPADITSAADNLRVIGADSMWQMGYTGEGTLVCIFDTGVEGDHPALEDSYRGKAGYSHEQCWFDPIDLDTFPHIFPDIGSRRSHGTSSMGLIVGKDDNTGDTTGVAFGAHWISAAVIDIGDPIRNGYTNTRLIEAFQWAADPDGNPNTVDDVPDVLSNSWGYPRNIMGCVDIFHRVMDNVEALGTIVLFSAGNSGPNPGSLTNPANRAEDMYNSFAVGMISNDYLSPVVDNQSSRGPSQCNGSIIKPNVLAPGRSVYTTYPISHYPTGYGNATGTSFSSPHAAGAALLLRQYNPNAPVDSIKRALMLGAIDLGDPGPDFDNGYGLIYVPEALNYLSPNGDPNVYIKSVTHENVLAGDTVAVVINLANSGLGVLDINTKLRTDRLDITLLDSAYTYGSIAMGAESDNTSDPYRIVFDEDIPEGTELTLDLNITGSGSYERTIPVYFLVGNKQVRDVFTHDAGVVQLTVSNFGFYGLAPGSIDDYGGVGFDYDNGSNADLYEMSFMIMADSNHISNSTRNMIGITDDDFKVTADGRLRTFIPSTHAAQHTLSKFTDEFASNPMGLEITQKTYAYNSQFYDHFILMVYIIKNISDSSLFDLKVSMFEDFDFFGQSSIMDRAGFDYANGVGFMWNDEAEDYRAIAVLNNEGVYTYRVIPNGILYNGFSKSEKWQFATEIFTDTTTDYSSDYTHLITTGLFDLGSGQSDTAAFAIIAADSLSDLLDIYTPQARAAYADFLTDVENENNTNPVLPSEFDLAQNYPNPFNPTTIIEFDLERGQEISLEIFNILGQKVETVLEEYRPAGKYRVTWNSSGKDKNLSSGIYFYRLKGETKSHTRKMILLK